MQDPFALLDLPRRMDLDVTLLETTFRRLAAICHPDQAEGSAAAFQQLQEATALLRNPATRLRYLANTPEPRSMVLPTEASQLFPTIISSLQQADALIAKYHAAQGSLTKALLLESLIAVRNELTSAHAAVEAWQQALQEKLHQLDSKETEITSAQLLELANAFTFAQRWNQQLRERKVALATFLN